MKNITATFRQLSPLRDDANKAWLMAQVRRWISQFSFRPSVFIEPFAGDMPVGLMIAVENLTDKVVLCEPDQGTAAVWKILFGGSDTDAQWLFDQTNSAVLTPEFLRRVQASAPGTTRELALRTILSHRYRDDDRPVIADGSLKTDENDKILNFQRGLEELVERLTLLRSVHKRVEFVEDDAFEVIERHAASPQGLFFIDASRSLNAETAISSPYAQTAHDRERLFKNMEVLAGYFLMVYEDDPTIEALAQKHNFLSTRVPVTAADSGSRSVLLLTKNLVSSQIVG